MSETETWIDNGFIRPFSVNRADNSGMVNLILGFYLKSGGGRVADLTYGRGSFWKRKPKEWALDAFDKEPIKPECERLDWKTFSERDFRVPIYDAAFFDPPYLKEGGFEFSASTNYGKHEGKSAWNTEAMKFGSDGGKMPLYLEKALFLAVKKEGIVVLKNTVLQQLRLFEMRDYLIQNLGPQPDWFQTKGKARINHAFWMVFRKPVE